MSKPSVRLLDAEVQQDMFFASAGRIKLRI